MLTIDQFDQFAGLNAGAEPELMKCTQVLIPSPDLLHRAFHTVSRWIFFRSTLARISLQSNGRRCELHYALCIVLSPHLPKPLLSPHLLKPLVQSSSKLHSSFLPVFYRSLLLLAIEPTAPPHGRPAPPHAPLLRPSFTHLSVRPSFMHLLHPAIEPLILSQSLSWRGAAGLSPSLSFISLTFCASSASSNRT